MRSNSLGSQHTLRSECRIPHNVPQQIEAIETELRDREFSVFNYIYDYWFIPNIIIGVMMVIGNIFYLVVNL